jgi:hypothetical protein
VLRAKLTTKFRLHDLRHTFAGLFVASGGDIFKLSKNLDYSSVAITQQVYAHLHPDVFAEDYSRVSFAMPEKPGAAQISGVTESVEWLGERRFSSHPSDHRWRGQGRTSRRSALPSAPRHTCAAITARSSHESPVLHRDLEM